MKRTLSLLLTLALVLGLTALPALGADPAVFCPDVSPGVTEAETAYDTKVPGMTLTLGADEWSFDTVDTPVSSESQAASYTTFLAGKTNPVVEEGKGTYYSFAFDDSVGAGSLEITYRLNSGKAFYILDNGQPMPGYDGMKLDVSADTSSTIIVEGGHTYTVYAKGSKLRLYGAAFQNVDPKEVFAQEIAAFPFERVKGVNADALHVDEDLVLVDSYESQFGSCDVNWTSSDPSVIDLDGTVNCQKTDAQVTLTGHFVVQEDRSFAADVTLSITVLADPDDSSAVAVAADALTLGDVSSVRRNLSLPLTGKRGTAITWASSDESVVEPDGKVHPAANEDKSAVLTATVARGDARETRDFSVTVVGIVPVTLDSWAYADKAGAVRFTPVDEGSLHSVSLTCNDPNPGADDVIVITVCGPEGEEKTSLTLSMAEVFAGTPVGKSVTAPVDLPMDSGDRFELTAKNAVTGQAIIAPVQADDALSDGAKVYVVGDSTASVYGDDRYPRKGWAQMLEPYFDGVEVVDLALSGRASKSFKKEANYATLKNSLKKGDWLIVQFGHNDNKADAYADPAPDRFTDGSYKQSMLEYVELAWEKGANPVIATSISRRKLSDESLEAYVQAARDLAAELSLPCIDLYAATNGWINEVGMDGAMDMFNCVLPFDTRFIAYPWFSGSEFFEKGSADDTHLNIYGADLISQWAAKAMEDLGLPLAAKLSGRTAEELPSYAAATSAAAPAFADMTGHWAKAAVDYAAINGIVQGTGESAFSPDSVTTRAMLATFLWRLAGEPEAKIKIADFPDVEDSWYTQAVRWCAQEGIVTGYEDGAFGVSDPVTREQMAVMLHRWAQARGLDVSAGEDADILGYEDASAVSDWAVPAVRWACGAGILSGKPGGYLAPGDALTRAETAAVLQRLAAQGQ